MGKKGLFFVLSLLVISGLFLIGCTKAPSSTSVITQTTGPHKGGTLRIIQGAEVNSLGWPSDQVSPEDYMQRGPVLETLAHYDEKANKSVGLLAESIVEDPVSNTITFNLRHNVKFHDGTVFDAEACAWNLEQIKGSVNLSASWTHASSIEIVDQYTVKVHFNEWDSTFLRNMCWDSAMISPTAYKEKGLDWIRDNPVGTGPFKLVSFQRDVKKVFARFDDYWQKGKPYLDGLEFNIIADSTVQLASFLKGENDIVIGLNPSDTQSLKDNPNVYITHGTAAGELISLFGDSGHPDSPFANIKVRQAVSYAIKNQDLNNFVFHGYSTLTNQMVVKGNGSYNPNVTGYPYDPQKARELLAEAGYPNGFNTVMFTRADKIYLDSFTAIQGYLADVGIKAELQTMNPGQYGGIVFGTGWSNGLLCASLLSDPEIGIMAFYHFSGASGLGIPQSAIHPKELDDAINNILSSSDPAKKQAAEWDFESLTTDKYCIYSPVLVFPPLAAKSTKVHDDYILTPYSSNPPIWTFADAWKEP